MMEKIQQKKSQSTIEKHMTAEEEDQESDPLSYAVIGAAMEVHRHLGPGLLESLYHRAMLVELALRRIPYRSQQPVEVYYKE
jgi:hypothetical protein